MGFKYLLKHWKTTFIAVLIGFVTILIPFKLITVEEWIIAIGAIGTVGGLLAKDWDKANEE